MSEHLDEAGLLRRLAALPREISPNKDPWPLISARIASGGAVSGSTPRRRVYWPLAAVASFVLVIAVGLLLRDFWTRFASAPSLSAPLTTMAVSSGGPDYTAANTANELEYQAALREFMTLNLAPGTDQDAGPEGIERGWGTLRRIERELTAALRQEPENEFLKSQLAVLRARQIELLQQLAALDSVSWRANI